MNSFAPLGVERGGDTVRIMMNRPERRNALAADHRLELRNAFIEAGRSDATPKVLGAVGPVFSAGYDFADVAARELTGVRELLELCTELMRTIQSVPQVVVARVHALTTAAGCQLVTSCDLAVAAESAGFAARAAAQRDGAGSVRLMPPHRSTGPGARGGRRQGGRDRDRGWRPADHGSYPQPGAPARPARGPLRRRPGAECRKPGATRRGSSFRRPGGPALARRAGLSYLHPNTRRAPEWSLSTARSRPHSRIQSGRAAHSSVVSAVCTSMTGEHCRSTRWRGLGWNPGSSGPGAG